MINLGWAKAKRKDNNEWAFGYVFRHDKFADGSEINTYLVSTAKDGEAFQERAVEFTMVWEETVCHDALCLINGNPVFIGDKLKQNDEEEGIVVWDDDFNGFVVKVEDNIWGVDTYPNATITGNIYDEFNLSKKEKKTLKKKKEAQ